MQREKSRDQQNVFLEYSFGYRSAHVLKKKKLLKAGGRSNQKD